MAQSAASQFRCCDCERDFKNETALYQHMRYKKVHKPKRSAEQQVASDRKVKCTKCHRTFQTESDMSRHLKSVRHKPLSNIKCLAGNDCSKKFKCPSAQIQHLESGRCKSGMTKAKLNAAIVANDPNNIITSKRSTTTNWFLNDSDSTASTLTSPMHSPILTPASSEYFDSYPPSGAVTPTRTSTSIVPIITQGRQRCPLCPARRTRAFEPKALQSHLASNVHRHDRMRQQPPSISPAPVPVPSLSMFVPKEEVIFHCPRALLGVSITNKGYKEFATVSALAQHLESGACDGGSNAFKLVVEYVQQELKHLGFGGLKLLR